LLNARFRRIAFIPVVVCFLLPAAARAEGQVRADEVYALTAWSADGGLSAPIDTVFAMAQDREGYLWLGTRRGLIRFDGSQFFPWGVRNEPPLPGRAVRALASSSDGSLWVTFADAYGVTRIQDGAVRTYADEDGLPEGTFGALLADRYGEVWAAGRNGLARFRDERWSIVRLETGRDLEAFSLYEDSSGRLWVGSSSGVLRRAMPEGPFEIVDRTIVQAESLAEGTDGVMWVTDPRRVVRSVNAARTLGYAPQLPSPAAGWRLVADRRGNVWTAAPGSGLLRVRVDAATGRHRLEPFGEGRIRGSVQTVFRDRDGNVWVGMHNGLLRLSESFVDTNVPLDGLTDEGVRALTVGSDGSVWAATTNSLNRFLAGRRQVYSQPQTMAMHTDSAGVVWIATTAGLSRFDRTSFVSVANVRLDRVSAMTTDRVGNPWLCNGTQGVLRLTRQGLERVEGDLPQRPCSTVYTDRGGRVWVGFTTGGVAVSDGSEWRAYSERDGLASGRVNAILEDRNRAIWLNTERGLSRFANGRFSMIDQRNGLPEQLERAMVEDGEGRLWLVVDGGSGLARIDSREIDKAAVDPSHQLTYDVYDKSDGFPSALPFWSPAAVRDRSGRLWFATREGVAVIDVAQQPKREPVVAPRIERLTADGVLLSPAETRYLPRDTSTVQIDYAALSLTAGTKLRFRYMMDGLDPDWVYAGVRRQVLFSNLQPGDYRFRVGVTNGGRWMDTEATWSFSVPPPFYRTTAFYVVLAAAVAWLVWAYWWLSMRAVRQRYALTLAERARVSREIHDTLLQSLGAVGIELEVVAHHLNSSEGPAGTVLQRLRSQVQQCVRDARQSIWELRSPSLDGRELADVLKDMAENTNWGRPVSVTVTSPERPCSCSSESQEQLVRIVREAVTNAVRHSHAQTVEVELTHRRRWVSVRVADDGVGFSPEAIPSNRAHCGLASMKERAARAGGHVTVTSSPGTGTIVEARVPSTRRWMP